MVSQRGLQSSPGLELTPRISTALWEGKSMRHSIVVSRLAAGSRGQTMAEYALILVTIAVVAAALVTNAGNILTEVVGHVSALF
jgi:Flp pilus assembly pilin Flp